MSIKNIYYKLNNESVKNFFVTKTSDVDTYFIVRDFLGLSENEIINLLIKNRKIIISDFSIICPDKMAKIFNQLKNHKQYLSNLYISKECYVKFLFHNDFYNILNELQMTQYFSVEDLIRSDTMIKSAAKIKFIESPSYLLKCIDNSLYIKKLSIEKFKNFRHSLSNEFNRFVEFYKMVYNNLIPSTSIFLEKQSAEKEIVCNVIDNISYKELIVFNSENVGIISTINTEVNPVSIINNEIVKTIGLSSTKKYGWIDLVDIKHKIKKFNINTLMINDLDCYCRLNEIQLCAEYGFNRHRTKINQCIDEIDSVIPFYYKYKGWNKTIQNIKNVNEIPNELITFLKDIKRLTEVQKVIVRLNYLEIII